MKMEEEEILQIYKKSFYTLTTFRNRGRILLEIEESAVSSYSLEWYFLIWSIIYKKLKLGCLSVTEAVIFLPSLELLFNSLSLLVEFADGADVDVLA